MTTKSLPYLKPFDINKETLNMTVKKRLVIGDIHGHIEPFKSIYKLENPDDVIVLGDYFDNFHGKDKEIIDCFKEILKIKRNHNKGEFILLIGNHDFHYMDLTETYSGKRSSYALSVSIMLDKCLENKELQFIYADDKNKTVYSHAGIMNRWLDENRLFIYDLNDLNNIDTRKYRFTFRGGDSGYGDGPFASPIWVRPRTLVQDMYKDYEGYTWTQIVGHTHGTAKTYDYDFKCISGCNKYNNINKTDQDDEYFDPILYVIDSLPNYYIIEELNEDGSLISREVKEYKN